MLGFKLDMWDWPLTQEVAFIEPYLDLQKARLEDRLDAALEVDPNVLPALIPKFVLQPW